MKRLTLFAALGLALAVAGCEDPSPRQSEVAPPAVEEAVAVAAEDQGVPAADTTAPADLPPAEHSPTEPRSSDQSVQPESETLFY